MRPALVPQARPRPVRLLGRLARRDRRLLMYSLMVDRVVAQQRSAAVHGLACGLDKVGVGTQMGRVDE